MQNIRYAMYLRKSTDSEDRQIQSIEDQRRELQKLISQFELNVVKVYEESQSAKAPGRLQFNQMITDIYAKEIDGILCWKINRLARNPKDGGDIQWALQRGDIRSILTPGREYKSEDNVMMMSVELGMANQFILDLSKDVKRGLYSKAEKGWKPGIAPLGYKNEKYAEKGNKRILIDEAQFPLMRKLWDIMLTGNYTVPAIADVAVNEFGMRTTKGKSSHNFSTTTLYRIFTNPFYYGEFTYAGEIYQGKHKPMITVEEYDQVQKILGKRGQPRPKYKTLPFNGIIRCGECGCSITCDEKMKKIISTGQFAFYKYHKCTKKKKVACSQKPIRTEDLSKQIEEKLEQFSLPQSLLDFALEVLRETNDQEIETRDDILNNHYHNLQDVQKRIDNLLTLFISDGNASRELLSEEEFKESKKGLVREKNRIQNKIDQINKESDQWLELTEKTFRFATYAKHWFQNGSPEEKTGILRAFGTNFILKDQKLTIEVHPALKSISDGAKKISSILSAVELEDFRLNKTKTANFQAAFDIVSG